MSGMRILFAVHGYKPAFKIGGPILSVSALAERLVQRGHRVTVVTSNSNQDEDLDVPLNTPVDVEGVEVRYFRRESPCKRWLPGVSYFSKSLGYLYSPEMAGYLRQVVPDVDVVHTHMPFVYPTWAAARAARRFAKPLFYHQRGVLDPERLKFRSLKKRLYLRLFELPVIRSAHTLVALTEAERESYLALGATNPCAVLPNGIDVSAYQQAADRGFDWQGRLSPSDTVLLFLGRLHPIKGAECLLRAFLQVQRQHPCARLVMAGPDEFSLEAKFRKVAREAGIAERVVFTGMLSGAAKHNMLARADLFCLPSDAEGFSMAVLEALASGTPVLLSPGCHFPEVEAAGVGRVVAKDSDSIAAALDQLLQTPAQLRRMGAAAPEFVRRNYCWETITDRLVAIYQRALQQQRITRHAETKTPVSSQAAA